MRARVRQNEGQRGLRMAGDGGVDPGRLAGRRTAAVRRGDEPGGDDEAVIAARLRSRAAEFVSRDPALDQAQPGRGARGALEGVGELRVFNVPAELFKTDLARRGTRPAGRSTATRCRRRCATRATAPRAFRSPATDPSAFRRLIELSNRATVRPLAAGSTPPHRMTSKPACAKPIAATSPASPAPTTRTSQESPGACASIATGFPSIGATNAAPAAPSKGLPPDIAELSHACFLPVQASVARIEAASGIPRGAAWRQGGHEHGGQAHARAECGGLPGPCADGFRRRRGAARALRGDRARLSLDLRLARPGDVHRRRRRHAGARRARHRNRRDDRRRRPRSRDRLSGLCGDAGGRAVALRSDADLGRLLDRSCRHHRLGALFRRHGA